MDNQEASQAESTELMTLTAEIVASYVSNNRVEADGLSSLIQSVFGTLIGLGAPPPEPVAEKPTPRMPIKKTITPDYLISLEDGRHYRSLKRHLTTRGMTPAEYRDKWSLPRDYPMVAPSYSAKRSELAKTFGLGAQRRKAPEKAGTRTSPSSKRRVRKPPTT